MGDKEQFRRMLQVRGLTKDSLKNQIEENLLMQKTRWNKQETSKILGIGRTTLYEKIRKYGLDTK